MLFSVLFGFRLPGGGRAAADKTIAKFFETCMVESTQEIAESASARERLAASC
jgi:hypothetical protein